MGWDLHKETFPPISAEATPKVAPEIPQEAAPAAPPPPRPDVWPYVSRRLEIAWVPNPDPLACPLWSAPVIVFNGVPHYRLTAAIVVWLELAGATLERGWDEGRGKVERAEIDAYLAAMDEVWRWAREWIGVDEVVGERERVRAAGGKAAALPEVYVPR